MFSANNTIVIWVTGRQLTLLGGKIAQPETIVFPPQVVDHLELLDHDALYALVKEWSVKHPAGAGEIVWIFGPDVYFEHVMDETERPVWDSVVVRFLDLLPFEEVESRVYTDTNGTKVVAINKDFYEGLVHAFALQGYTTRAEVVAGEVAKLGMVKGLNSQVVAHVSRNLEALVKGRIVTDENYTEEFKFESGSKPKSSLPLLLSVFGVLIAILGLMIWRMYR